MRIVKICFVMIVGLCLLSGCGAPSKEPTILAKAPSAKPQQPMVKAEGSSIATVTGITKGTVPDKPGVTRVIIALDRKASHSVSREGNQLIVNVLNATMKSSIKQIEVRDPVIKSITARQVGKSVKGLVELVNQDVAYTPSTSTDPFQIFLDIWPISSKTALKRPSGEQESTADSTPIKSIDITPSQRTSPETPDSRTKEITLDVRKTPEKELTPLPRDDVPAQLQWFSEKLSQVLQEREQVKQELLEVQKAFAVKDSMIQVLERKLKESNYRIVELEEQLIKANSKTSMAEQNEQDLRKEINQLLIRWEKASGEEVTTAEIPSEKEEIQSRSAKILEKLSALQQKMEGLNNQVASLTQERDDLQSQVNTCSTELTALRRTTAKVAAIEKELRVKETEMARLRKAIGDAAQLVMGTPQETPSRAAQIDVSPTSEVQAMGTETPEGMPGVQGLEEPGTGEDTQLSLADLIRKQQLLEQAASPEDYVLGPEDVVQIKVLKEENLDKTVTVSSDGFITYPLLGDLRVEGLTVAQVDAQITSLLARDFLVDPEIIVDVIKQRSKKVYIMGAVKQPGYHELSKDQKLLGTLLSAGGPTSFNTEVRVLRLPKGEEIIGEMSTETLSPIVVDLNRLFVEGDQTQNITLHDGDVLMIASKSSASSSSSLDSGLGAQQFYVVGSVTNPGVYNYKASDTVLDAILRAGGFTEFASRNSTKLVRELDGRTRTFRIKMKDVMEKGEMDENMEIMPGDMIIVPESFF